MSKGYSVPVVDLDQICDETELLPVVKRILRDNDTFLLKNYANKKALDDLLGELKEDDFPDAEEGFDANFTGVLQLTGDVLMEQYIFSTDQTLKFDRECRNETLRKVYARLFKVALFFAQICLKSVGAEVPLTETSYSAVLNRFFHGGSDTSMSIDGETFQYASFGGYRDLLPTGVLTVFPAARGIKYKPPTMGSGDSFWVAIDEPDCLLFHTGTLLAHYSGGSHSTSTIRISSESNILHLTLAPPLATVVDSSGERLADRLLRQQIVELPEVAKSYYPREAALIQLEKTIAFYKELFSTCETVLPLYAMSRSTHSAPRLGSLLPQISNMMRGKVSQQDFLKMVSLWPDCYVLQADSKGELTVKQPKLDQQQLLINKSRRLEFVERADSWLSRIRSLEDIPTDVPAWKVSKRRGSGGSEPDPNNRIRRTAAPSPRKRNYVFNSAERFNYAEKEKDSQSNLLERLRERERRSAALLSQRQRNYDQFLAVKMKQVFEILYSLPQGKPYTVTHLGTLIVDSLQDSNNPIGFEEADTILSKLQGLLNKEVTVQTADGGLKVYRWKNLNRDLLLERIDRELSSSQRLI
ncbi:hypothetical protein HG536_0B05800 [Torulaspora globosa]|uniref:DNA replication factor Cdt1 C-terminal domain-containing protein n=1 Tax=Torulaspora globosa TaxID=48254 RepID=A0A7G3ZDX9_9SACH|nr:uncharacterized protein HG536_0B05800 [Torulaspora globosa]QLL31715.1 hypothetical protein HG536_0B05800 [Torulaspora globosa]